MPPTAAATAPSHMYDYPGDDVRGKGINAVLLGPPGSGKGTQVCNSYITHRIIILTFYYFNLGSVTQRKVLCVPFINRRHAEE